jgi:guanylate kinase
LEQIQGELDTTGNYVTIPFIRELLGKVPNSGWYYSDEFEQNALAIFDSCDTNKDSVLTGRELQVALLALLPEARAEDGQQILLTTPRCQDAENGSSPTPRPAFSEDDRSMLELQKTFAAILHIEMVGGFGIPRSFMPAFARYCYAWRLYSYWNTPQIDIEQNEHKQAKMDLIFIGGAFIHRREDIVAKLFLAYHEFFDFPVAHTDRPKHVNEIEGLHYIFISKDEFTSKESDTRGGFIYTYEEHGARYGYLYSELVRPNRERGKVAILPAGKTSAARACLQEREDRPTKDFNIVTVCFGAPPEDDEIDTVAPRSVIGSCWDYYCHHPTEWIVEVAREEEDWDFFLSPDMDEAAAHKSLEAYIKECLEGKKKKKGKKQQQQEKAATKIQSKVRQKKAKQVAAEKKAEKDTKPEKESLLSPAALYDILAVDKETRYAVHVTPQRLKKLYENTRLDGLTDEFVQLMSAGQVTGRLPPEEVEEMATSMASDANGKLGRETLSGFMAKLSDALGIDVTMLVRAFRQTEEGHHPGAEDLIQKLFILRKKTYKYGSTFTGSDWTVVCRALKWISVGGFQQADAELAFKTACKVEKQKKDQKEATIWKEASYGILMDETARRRGKPALEAVGEIWRIAMTYDGGAVSTATSPAKSSPAKSPTKK